MASSDGFENLVLPVGYKSIIMSMVNMHSRPSSGSRAGIGGGDSDEHSLEIDLIKGKCEYSCLDLRSSTEENKLKVKVSSCSYTVLLVWAKLQPLVKSLNFAEFVQLLTFLLRMRCGGNWKTPYVSDSR